MPTESRILSSQSQHVWALGARKITERIAVVTENAQYPDLMSFVSRWTMVRFPMGTMPLGLRCSPSSPTPPPLPAASATASASFPLEFPRGAKYERYPSVTLQ